MTETHLAVDIQVREVQGLIDSQETFLLLDCRNPDEYDLVHLHSAKLIPVGELTTRIAELEPHRNDRIVRVLSLGGRSQMVAAWLRENNFTKVQNMVGGIQAWAEEIDRSLPRYS